MAYIVGIDGGGTKTAVTIAHDQEESLFTFTVGPINYNGGDADAIAASFEEIFNRTRHYCGDLRAVAHICIGAAGISNPLVVRLLEQHVRSNGYNWPLTITGDQETALYGARHFPRLRISGSL